MSERTAGQVGQRLLDDGVVAVKQFALTGVGGFEFGETPLAGVIDGRAVP
jgi:hypothetical protein